MYEAEKEHYDREGYCVIRNFLSPEELQVVERELKIFLDEVAPTLKRQNINFEGSGKINSIHCLAGPEAPKRTHFQDLLESPKFLGISEILLGDKVDTRKVEFFAKPAKGGLPSPWHQDNAYWCVSDGNALTLRLSLDTADEKNGGVHYISKSHLWKDIPHKKSFAPGSSQMIADESLIQTHGDELVCPRLNPGDCMIHHSYLVHGSYANQDSRPRRGVTFSYKAKSSYYDLERISRYKAALEEQIDQREGSQRS